MVVTFNKWLLDSIHGRSKPYTDNETEADAQRSRANAEWLVASHEQYPAIIAALNHAVDTANNRLKKMNELQVGQERDGRIIAQLKRRISEQDKELHDLKTRLRDGESPFSATAASVKKKKVAPDYSALFTPPEPVPSIGRIVHYVTSTGDHKPAIITSVDGDNMDLTIFGADKDVNWGTKHCIRATLPTHHPDPEHRPFTWHWPEMVTSAPNVTAEAPASAEPAPEAPHHPVPSEMERMLYNALLQMKKGFSASDDLAATKRRVAQMDGALTEYIGRYEASQPVVAGDMEAHEEAWQGNRC